MSDERRILVGEILKAHGLKGEVKLKSFTDDPLAIASYGPFSASDGERLTLVSLRPGPGALLAKFEGVGDRDRAEALRGLKLYVDRDVLPKPETDEFYHADLIGLAARDPSGAEIGRVNAIYDFGAGDVIEIIRQNESAPLLLPFTDDMVPEVNVEAGFVRLGEAALEAHS
jgi:16S rRNA processing protein RimM